MEPISAVNVKGLVKRYGAIEAVKGISFEVRAGETFGLLGPNGAGKSTTIHIMVGAIKPDEGSVDICGIPDPTKPYVRMQIGFAPQALSLYQELSAEKNLAFFGKLYGIKGEKLSGRVDWALDFAGLNERRKDAVSTFSGGMKRRLNLATSLIHEPRVIFLDEPMVGVDPQSRNHMMENIETLKKLGRTIIYTTHYMEEAEKLCDRVAIMDQGKIFASGTVDELLDEYGGKSIFTARLRELPKNPSDLPGTLNGKDLQIETTSPMDEIIALSKKGFSPVSIKVERPDLEKVFLNITGKSLRD